MELLSHVRQNIRNFCHSCDIFSFTGLTRPISRLCNTYGQDCLLIRRAGDYTCVISGCPNQCPIIMLIWGYETRRTRRERRKEERFMKKLKSVGSAILNALSGSLVPLIPVLIGAAMFKTLLAVFGPEIGRASCRGRV